MVRNITASKSLTGDTNQHGGMSERDVFHRRSVWSVDKYAVKGGYATNSVRDLITSLS